MPQINVRWADNTETLKKNLKEGVTSIEATRTSVEKLVQSLSGEKLISAAHRMAAAIQEVGGVTKLTAAEQTRANAIFEKAAEKLTLAGKGGTYAATTFKDLAAATKQSADASTTAAGAHNKLFETLRLNVPIVSGLSARFSENVAALGAIGGVVGGAVIGFEALRKGAGLASEVIASSVKAYSEAEAAQVKLTAALKTAGLAAPETLKQYNALASEFQHTTVFSDDLITSMQALLTQVGGVMPSQMKAALQASTDLAAGLGIDLQSATTLVAKAAAGHTETLGRYGITVSDAALQTKGFSAVLEAINRQFGGQAAAQVDTYAGRIEQLNNNLNNVREAIGKLIVTNPILELGLRKAAEAASAADDGMGGLTLSIGDLLQQQGFVVAGPMIKWLETLAASANASEAAMASLDARLKATGGTVPGFLPPTLPAISPQQAVANLPDTTKLQFALQDLHTKTEGLTAAQKTLANAAFATGLGVAEVTKILDANGLSVARNSDALTVLKQQFDAAKEAAKRMADATKNINTAVGGLGAILDTLPSGPFAIEFNGKALAGSLADVILQLKDLGVSESDIAVKFHLTEVQVKAVTAAHAQAIKIIELEAGANAGLAESLARVGVVDSATIPQLKARLDLTAKLASIERVGLPSFGGDLEKVGRIEKQLTFDEMVRGLSTSQRIVFSIHESLATLPNILIQAFTGGGNLGGALKGLATQISSGLFGGEGDKAGPLKGITDKLTSTVTKLTAGLGKTVSGILGSVVGGFLPGIGGVLAAGIGKIFSALGGIGGPSKAEKTGRDAASSFEKGIAEGLSATQKAEAGTDTWRMTVIGVRDAYLATGRSAQQAERDVARLWAAEKQGPAAVAAIEAEIQTAFDDLKKVNTGVDALVSAWNKAGSDIPQSMRDTIASLLRMNGLTDDQRAKLQGLLDASKPQFESLKNEAAGFGISLEALGPKFEQGDLEERAKTLTDFIRKATDAGGDLGGILLGLSDEISGVVQESIKFGTAIPDNMKPFIENLIAAGKLTDENGAAITDISKINFEATPLNQSLIDLNTTLQDLVKTLEGLNGQTITTTVRTNYETTGSPPGQTVPGQNTIPPNETPAPAEGGIHGGLVTTAGIMAASFARGGLVPATLPHKPLYLGTGGLVSFIPRGPDIIPAMLMPNEEVLTPLQRHEISADLVSGANMAATLKDLIARIAMPGADTQGQVLLRLNEIRDLLAQPTDTVVQVDGETIVRASHRVYDDNARGLRSRAQDLLGIARP